MPEPRYGVLNLMGLACATVVSSDYHARKQRSTAVSGTSCLLCYHTSLECTGDELSDMIVYMYVPSGWGLTVHDGQTVQNQPVTGTDPS
jgi:hypothetical protein